ncbi:MAG TPA: tetratricopeptide repeat protein [Gallionella sp.]|nr:tetratricopeptide repeat protein [Gallionella sp.]
MGKAIKGNSCRLALAIILLAGGASAQAGLQEGVSAYKRGHFSIALKELAPLAEKGDAKAQTILGEMHSSGSGVPQDHAKAAFWYRKAAEQGNVSAQTSLGVMYERGLGIPQDEKEAASWLRKAAEQGHAEALYTLGGMYERGQGAIQADLVQAHKWFNIAVAAGFDIAQDNLDEIETKMSHEQIEAARSMAKEWLATHKLPAHSGPLK